MGAKIGIFRWQGLEDSPQKFSKVLRKSTRPNCNVHQLKGWVSARIANPRQLWEIAERDLEKIDEKISVHLWQNLRPSLPRHGANPRQHCEISEKGLEKINEITSVYLWQNSSRVFPERCKSAPAKGLVSARIINPRQHCEISKKGLEKIDEKISVHLWQNRSNFPARIANLRQL
ncbi:hypothetical protein OQ279_11040 [Salinimicrobium sp. MT39]|uniref:Uncharacterized protein n=1 Tax=Salinimicrobium profundisediminis TaxID=2994553 RepID=A0A9X3CXK1_9FLAO|nr:hypothetical protein [Salinimicrobium profundisediminis]MCX2838681.1 hypothetical protein [Salinimicrobium profundisediminis]